MARILVTTLFIGYLISMFVSTHLPTATVAPTVDVIGDKRVHLLSFAVLSFLCVLTLWMWRKTLSAPQLLCWGIAAVTAYAIFDETTQPLFGRNFEWMDLFADVYGLCLGGSSALIAIRYFITPQQIESVR